MSITPTVAGHLQLIDPAIPAIPRESGAARLTLLAIRPYEPLNRRRLTRL